MDLPRIAFYRVFLFEDFQPLCRVRRGYGNREALVQASLSRGQSGDLRWFGRLSA
jgi:hypothetical protein